MKQGARPVAAQAGSLVLLVDAGNTRVKSALLAGGQLRALPARPWRVGAEASAAKAVLAAAVARAGSRPIDRVLACSVAGAPLERALARATRAQGLPAPRFVRSRRRTGGVRNGYSEPWRLGADRFVALVGARALHPGRPLCLVDAGTALTIDVIDAAGRHAGGLLVPGPALMVEALLGQTALIRRRAGAGDVFARAASGAPFGRSTRAGLAAGAQLACAALIERAAAEARALLGRAPRVLVSGGAAPLLARRLRVRALAGDGFVFAGLALLAGSPPAPQAVRKARPVVRR